MKELRQTKADPSTLSPFSGQKPTRPAPPWLDLMLQTHPKTKAAKAQKAYDEKAVAEMRKQIAARPPGDGLVLGTVTVDGHRVERRVTPSEAGMR